jgi:hypothetical protein
MSAKRRPIYPPTGLPPIAGSSGSESLMVPGRAASDAPTLSHDANPFGYLRPSMARLSLESSEGMVGRSANLGLVRKSRTMEAEQPVKQDKKDNSGFGSDDFTSSASFSDSEETKPLSTSDLSQLLVALKELIRDKKIMHILRSQGFDPHDDISNTRNRRKTRGVGGGLDHHLLTMAEEVERDGLGPLRERGQGNLTSSGQDTMLKWREDELSRLEKLVYLHSLCFSRNIAASCSRPP